jgi:hypothetical protein
MQRDRTSSESSHVIHQALGFKHICGNIGTSSELRERVPRFRGYHQLTLLGFRLFFEVRRNLLLEAWTNNPKAVQRI